MVHAIADAKDAPIDIWDRGIWDFYEGEDFDDGEWRILACELKAIATMLGGVGSAAEIVHRDKKSKIVGRTFRWQYIAMKHGWRGRL